MASKYLIFLCLLGTISFVATQGISCYDCDPRTSAEACANPAASNANVSVCASVENSTSICYSSFMKFSGERENDTGIYRGCKILWPGVQDFCDWFQEERQGVNVTIPSCITCTTSKCNTIRFNADGTSAASSISSAVILGLSCLLVILLGLLD